MRRLLLLAIVCATLLTHSAHAQFGLTAWAQKRVPNITIGVKAGLNMQRMSGSTIFSGDHSSGPLVGATASFDQGRNMSIRVELLAKMAKMDLLPYKATVKSAYLDIPILFEYLVADVVWIQLGPQYTRMLSARNTSMGSGSNVRKLYYRSNDIALVGGVEVVVSERLSLGARYIQGLLDINGTGDTNSPAWHNTGLQFTAGYCFFN